MISRPQQLCRQLKPVLGRKIDRLWQAYLAESDVKGKADIEQTLELLAAKYLKKSFEIDSNPFPPPPESFSKKGEIKLGAVSYAHQQLYPFYLQTDRLKEHILLCGRSGSGKTNLAFILMDEIIDAGVKVLALDWKRGYRDLLNRHKNMKVYTIGRDISPFRFNPFISPPGCEPSLWIKLIVESIAQAYLGGEGVISLLISGLDHLYREYGIYDDKPVKWPTVQDLLGWLKNAKLKGRASLWKTSTERILTSLLFGEFGKVLNTQDNSHIADLLKDNVVLEMDGLSSSNDKTLFSEALTLYLYRYRLAQGPKEKLTNMIILEEAHNLLHKKSSESKESVLETSIRMIREYGVGYVFIDQSASLLSKVAFANSYATIALSQKLRSDVQAISSAMNLTDEQKQALNTLEVGSAVVRLADKFSQGFMLKIPLSPIKSGKITDTHIRQLFGGDYSDSGTNNGFNRKAAVVSDVSVDDKKCKISGKNNEVSHPPIPPKADKGISAPDKDPPANKLNREEIRFLSDLILHPLSTTVNRYKRLNLSRRKGNAIRKALQKATLIRRVAIPTRSGQVVLFELTDNGRTVCKHEHIDIKPVCRESLEHRFWVRKIRDYYESKGSDVVLEHPVKGNGAIDLLAKRPGEKIAVEVETGKSNIKTNIENLRKTLFDKKVVFATSPVAVEKCQKAINKSKLSESVDLMIWLDV
jgi:hypothetical protein